jgi:hypothetical protein
MLLITLFNYRYLNTIYYQNIILVNNNHITFISLKRDELSSNKVNRI